jgi:hypothetical protein
MAEIEIQKKKQPIWPWILGAIVLVGLLWFLVAQTGRDRDVERPVAAAQEAREPARTTAPMIPEVQEYITYVRQGEATEDAGLEHEYTSEGIRNLADAINAIAQRTNVHNDQIAQQHEELHQMADQIQQDPHSTRHANIIRNAFATSADMMEQVQTNQFPNLDGHVSQVRQAAQNVDPQQQTLDQKQEIQNFFDQASHALQAMEGAAGRDGQTTDHTAGHRDG